MSNDRSTTAADTAPVPDDATSTRSTAPAAGVNPADAWIPYTPTSCRNPPVVVTDGPGNTVPAVADTSCADTSTGITVSTPLYADTDATTRFTRG